MKILITEQQFNLLLEAKASKFKQLNYPEMSDKTFHWVVSLDKVTSDIDNNIIGKYAIWILKMFKYGDNSDFNFINNDPENISQCIEFYDRNLSKFEVKDIFQYKNYKMFFYDVDDVKKNIKTKVTSKDYTKVYEDNEWLVIIPRTKEASCKYGSNTRWCTAARNDNRFTYYNSKENGGPLYYFINKINHEKFAYHNKGNDYSPTIFNDEDVPVDVYKTNFSEKVMQVYLKIKIQNNVVLTDDEYNLLHPDLLPYYFNMIISNNFYLPEEQFDEMPYDLKIKYTKKNKSNY
jgi:hypothetical protein